MTTYSQRAPFYNAISSSIRMMAEIFVACSQQLRAERHNEGHENRNLRHTTGACRRDIPDGAVRGCASSSHLAVPAWSQGGGCAWWGREATGGWLGGFVLTQDG